MAITVFVTVLACMRFVVGLGPILAAGPLVRAFGVPAGHDTPTTRLMARFFGVRNLGLGVMVLYALRHPPLLAPALLLNALMDLGDLVAVAVPLLRRQGIDRAARRSGAMALTATLAWLGAWALVALV